MWWRPDGARAYFAGDTGYPSSFAEIARRLGSPDVALLPIGAYEPRWFMAPQHMNPADAMQAHRDLGARLSIAIHFATFHLTDEAIDAPALALAAALKANGVSAVGLSDTDVRRVDCRAGRQRLSAS